jgi:hypothetical protein
MGSPKGVKPRGELNFFNYSDNKRFSLEPDVVEYNKTLIAKVLVRT